MVKLFALDGKTGRGPNVRSKAAWATPPPDEWAVSEEGGGNGGEIGGGAMSFPPCPFKDLLAKEGRP
jgi:hypothetical protein